MYLCDISCFPEHFLRPNDWDWFLFQLDEQVVATLVQNLDRLDESVKEEAQGIHNTLGKR